MIKKSLQGENITLVNIYAPFNTGSPKYIKRIPKEREKLQEYSSWRRKWQATLVLLPGECHGQRLQSMGLPRVDTTEQLTKTTEFNTLLPSMDRPVRLKITTATEVLDDTMEQLDLIDTYRALHPKKNILSFKHAWNTLQGRPRSRSQNKPQQT